MNYDKLEQYTKEELILECHNLIDTLELQIGRLLNATEVHR